MRLSYISFWANGSTIFAAGTERSTIPRSSSYSHITGNSIRGVEGSVSIVAEVIGDMSMEYMPIMGIQPQVREDRHLDTGMSSMIF